MAVASLSAFICGHFLLTPVSALCFFLFSLVDNGPSVISQARHRGLFWLANTHHLVSGEVRTDPTVVCMLKKHFATELPQPGPAPGASSMFYSHLNGLITLSPVHVNKRFHFHTRKLKFQTVTSLHKFSIAEWLLHIVILSSTLENSMLESHSILNGIYWSTIIFKK